MKLVAKSAAGVSQGAGLKGLSTEEGRAQIADYASPAKVEDRRAPWRGQPSLGVSTEGARRKAQGQRLKLSQAIYDQLDAQGLIYSSRPTGRLYICVYDRALPAVLKTSSVVEVTRLAGSTDALREPNVTLIARF